MRARLRALFAAALADLEPGHALRAHLLRDDGRLRCGAWSIDLPALRQAFVVAIGKAARPMAAAALPLLAGVRVQGIVVPPRASGARELPPLELHPGGHPLPDAGSLAAADRTLALLGNAAEPDLVLFLLSGGGSALCERPPQPSVSLADLQALHRLLLGSGAGITAMNVVRKHCSGVKGGRLAVRAAAAAQLTLLVSDVPAGGLDVVASGPTLPDPSTLADLDAVLDRYGLRARLPGALRALLQRRQLAETPKPGHPAFLRAHWQCILDQDAATAALQRRAEEAGLPTEVVAAGDELTAPALADLLLEALAAQKARAGGRPAAVVAGGELSVPLPTAPGRGGRNQQFALECALRMKGRPIAVLSCGTDGIDGDSDAAGAVADGTTVARALALGLDAEDHLRRCDAAPLFAALGDAVVTGPTGTNVRDLRLLVHG